MTSASPGRLARGDFQTPLPLARDVAAFLVRLGVRPRSVVEPTAGDGAFLVAARETIPGVERALGVEIDPEKAARARAALEGWGALRVDVADAFRTDWEEVLSSLPSPVLVLGNPPWVTVASARRLGSENVPSRSPEAAGAGLEAVTGSSNFDVSEWIVTRIVEALRGRPGHVAMLLKTHVARRLLVRACRERWEIASARLAPFSARARFGVSAGACLLVLETGFAAAGTSCEVFEGLDADSPAGALVVRGGRLLRDGDGLRRFGHLLGQGPSWRSGVKHDAKAIFELTARGDRWVDGRGDEVDVEPDVLFPFLKGTDVARGVEPGARRLLLPQLGTSDDTLARRAPRAYAWLEARGERLARRRSAVYRHRPRYAVFGVGPYTFAPWKVAVSALHRDPAFRVIGPWEGRPVVFDDSVNLLPFDVEDDARRAAALLGSEPARALLASLAFPDAKRPFTASLLSSLDLDAIAEEIARAAPGPRRA